MMEQRSQMLRQRRLTKTEREREVSGFLVWGRGGWQVRPLETPLVWDIRMRPPFSHGTEATSSDFPQAQLVKDRHSALRLESLYSDEEDDSAAGADKIQMTWTRDKYMAAESWDPSHGPDNFRELVHIKP